MSYEQLQQFITAPILYGNVTLDEVEALTVNHYLTTLGGINYIGTFDPVDALADRQIFPTAVIDTPAE